jgi:SnoaL-like domain
VLLFRLVRPSGKTIALNCRGASLATKVLKLYLHNFLTILPFTTATLARTCFLLERGEVSERIVKQFVEALGRLESSRELEPIVSLFADNAEINNVTLVEGKQGQVGAEEFWRIYRETFDEMKSTFRNQLVMDGKGALEWQTMGSSKNGHRIRYEGVSMLEIEGDKITRFFAYFDPRNLGRQIEDTDVGDAEKEALNGQ